MLALLATLCPGRAANVFWTGPTNTFTHAPGGAPDKLTTNHIGADAVNNVWLDRGAAQPLYNAAAESAWNGSTSPVNTMWAVASGSLTNAASLSYNTFDNVVGQPGNSPRLSVGKTFFVKIVSDNIYLQLKLTEWGNNDGGSFAYERTTPAAVVAPTPTISITNPVSGKVFAAPASVSISASAGVSSGTVTNVQFFTNNVLLASLGAAPFTATTHNLGAGACALTAVATAAGISATSAPVNVSVVTPVPVTLSAATRSGGVFSFNYSANPGLSYAVQVSSNLLNWAPLATNQAAVSLVPFSGPATTGAQYYRIALMPNP